MSVPWRTINAWFGQETIRVGIHVHARCFNFVTINFAVGVTSIKNAKIMSCKSLELHGSNKLQPLLYIEVTTCTQPWYPLGPKRATSYGFSGYFGSHEPQPITEQTVDMSKLHVSAAACITPMGKTIRMPPVWLNQVHVHVGTWGTNA